MTILLFRHNGWDIATSIWSVGRKTIKEPITNPRWVETIELCYGWQLCDSYYNTTLRIGMSDFLKRIANGGVVDLHDVST